jgi:hypothetical protein
VVVADNDPAGANSAQAKADFALKHGATSVRIVYPHKEKKDITDHVQGLRKLEWTNDAIVEDIEAHLENAEPYRGGAATNRKASITKLMRD